MPVPATWWLIIFLLAGTTAGLVRKISNALMISLPFFTLFCVFMNKHGYENAMNRWHYTPETCISLNHDRLGLRDGLAGYWMARKVESSSDWKLQVEQAIGGNCRYE